MAVRRVGSRPRAEECADRPQCGGQNDPSGRARRRNQDDGVQPSALSWARTLGRPAVFMFAMVRPAVSSPFSHSSSAAMIFARSGAGCSKVMRRAYGAESNRSRSVDVCVDSVEPGLAARPPTRKCASTYSSSPSASVIESFQRLRELTESPTMRPAFLPSSSLSGFARAARRDLRSARPSKSV